MLYLIKLFLFIIQHGLFDVGRVHIHFAIIRLQMDYNVEHLYLLVPWLGSYRNSKKGESTGPAVHHKITILLFNES